MREKVVMWATNAAEKKREEAVLMDVGIVEGGGCEGRRMSRVRVGGCGATFVRITWPVNAPRRAKVREGRKVEERE